MEGTPGWMAWQSSVASAFSSVQETPGLNTGVLCVKQQRACKIDPDSQGAKQETELTLPARGGFSETDVK